MAHFVGLGVSVRIKSACVVNDAGKVLCERKVSTEPDDIALLLTSVGGGYVRVGVEAGPLSHRLVNGLSDAGLPVICIEIRHMKALLQAQQINKSDRIDACGVAQMFWVGLLKPVHVKTLAAQEQRLLLVTTYYSAGAWTHAAGTSPGATPTQQKVSGHSEVPKARCARRNCRS